MPIAVGRMSLIRVSPNALGPDFLKGHMNILQFLHIVRARARIILLMSSVTVLAAMIVSISLPKSYVASTSLVLNYKGVDPVTGITLPAQLMPGYMATQVDIVKSKSVAFAVQDALKLADHPQLKRQFMKATNGEGVFRDWLADRMLTNLEVTPSRESSVLSISFKGNDPDDVTAIANAFGNAYRRVAVQLKVEPAQEASGYFLGQLGQLREGFEQAQKKLSTYQRAHNIFSADNRLDVETARLNELSTQLVQAQGQAIESSSRQRATIGNAGTSPDILNNPLIQGLKAGLATAEAKFAETAQRLQSNHPQYLSAKSEVDKLRSNLNEQIRFASSGVESNARINQQREGELRAALAIQKEKVTALNSARDELSVLTNEMENAKRAYDSASQRYAQTNIEGQSKQSDIAVLTVATKPRAATSPDIVINLLMSALIGTILGVGAALTQELLDQRVRSANHLANAFGLPVLAVIERSISLNRRRAAPLALPAPAAPPIEA